MYTYKFRIYPNKEQQALLANSFWCCRFVYNKWIATRQEMYKKWEKANYYTLAWLLKERKQELPRLKVAYSQSLQQSLKNLDRAYKNFFAKRSKYPRFKKKFAKQSCHFPQHTSIEGMKIKFPKLWLVRCKLHRSVEGCIKNMTITRTPSWKYYVSICTDHAPQKPRGTGSVGIDVGIKELGYCSDGYVIKNPKFLKKAMKRLKKQQRFMSRKKKGSRNRNKQRVRVARLYEKVTSQRRDYLHKVSTRLQKNYETVVVEDLNINNMVKNHCLAQAIIDVSRWMFFTMLDYKTNLIKVKPHNTSKTCSRCGHVKEKLSLEVRAYTCGACWLIIDRDYNASLNILARATT